MSPSPDKTPRRPLRWLPAVAVALLALAPKCLLCRAADAGGGALLGVKLGGPEICGDFAGHPVWPWFALAGASFGIVVFYALDTDATGLPSARSQPRSFAGSAMASGPRTRTSSNCRIDRTSRPRMQPGLLALGQPARPVTAEVMRLTFSRQTVAPSACLVAAVVTTLALSQGARPASLRRLLRAARRRFGQASGSSGGHDAGLKPRRKASLLTSAATGRETALRPSIG